MTLTTRRLIAGLSLALIIIGVSSPLFALAQPLNQGIVQCGNPGQDPCGKCGLPDAQQSLCGICNLAVLAIRLVNFGMQYLAGPAIVIMLIWGGFTFLFAGGSPAKIQAGQKILWNTVIGALIVFGAYFMIDTTIKALSGDFSASRGAFKNIGPWNKPSIFNSCGGTSPENQASPQTQGDVRTSTQKVIGVITRLAQFFGVVIAAVSVFAILYAAWSYIVSAGDKKKAQTARIILTYAVVGIAVALLASVLPAMINLFFAS